MSLSNRMNDIGFLRTKKAIQNKTYEEYKGQSDSAPEQSREQSEDLGHSKNL